VTGLATPFTCARCIGRLQRDQALRSAQRLAAGGFALAAVCALALLVLLVKPVMPKTGTLGINDVEISTRIGTAGMPMRK